MTTALQGGWQPRSCWRRRKMQKKVTPLRVIGYPPPARSGPTIWTSHIPMSCKVGRRARVVVS